MAEEFVLSDEEYAALEAEGEREDAELEEFYKQHPEYLERLDRFCAHASDFLTKGH